MKDKNKNRVLDAMSYDNFQAYDKIVEESGLSEDEVSQVLSTLVDRGVVEVSLNRNYRKKEEETGIRCGKGSGLFSRLFLGADY
jgi:DNA-binding transcriptional regulator LsrR (DeoR family)